MPELQLLSVPAKSDPKLTLWPIPNDRQFPIEMDQAARACAGTLPGNINGATFYYAPRGLAPQDRGEPLRVRSGETVLFPMCWNRS